MVCADLHSPQPFSVYQKNTYCRLTVKQLTTGATDTVQLCHHWIRPLHNSNSLVQLSYQILDVPVLESEDRTNLWWTEVSHIQNLVHSTSGPHPQKWSFCPSSQCCIVMSCSSNSQCRLDMVWSLMRSQNCCGGMQYGSRLRHKRKN